MYIKILFIVLISISVSLVSAQSPSFHLISKIPNTFYDGDIPKITGIVLDQSYKPVSDAQIRIKYPSETIQVTSTADGSFNVSPTIPLELGSLYGTSIIISKQGYTTSVFPIQYSVIERPSILPIINTTSIEKLQDTGIKNEITNSSIDKFLEKQIELSQTKLEIIQNNTDQNNMLNEQRKIAQETLKQDITKSEDNFAKYNPFNVFSEFVVGFDDSIRNIFLGQFAVTQNQHQEGQKAQNAALANGQDSKSAMIAFQEKAKISRDAIIDLNNQLNANFKPVNQSENSTLK
ncbi:MAG: carboxypeptidase-like regulatory domain-containing protein [Nitrosarchaeum sp.]|nr:carboxypeptidase-like regulatory domain-containing protein [Nitrosarchaeum sp.]